ncbi:MAG: hypothetical protein ABIK31_08065, partial [candidate division WOR-3 bacterium]
FTHTASQSAEPEISAFIFCDAPYKIICQPLVGGIVGKRFPIVFTHSTSISAEPEISETVYARRGNGVKGKSVVGGKVCEIGNAAFAKYEWVAVFV